MYRLAWGIHRVVEFDWEIEMTLGIESEGWDYILNETFTCSENVSDRAWWQDRIHDPRYKIKHCT